jgi:hypothetical protein
MIEDAGYNNINKAIQLLNGLQGKITLLTNTQKDYILLPGSIYGLNDHS